MEANRIESLPISSAPKSAVHERPGSTGPPTQHPSSTYHSRIASSLPDAAASSESPLNSCSGFFTNSQNFIINGGNFILNVWGEQHGASDRKSPLRSKGEAERDLNPFTSDAQYQQHGFIGKSTTVDGLSYTPSQEEKTPDAEQIIVTNRKSKSWKTLRGRGEAVWPPLFTRKQVGSRLRQLRGICKGDKNCCIRASKKKTPPPDEPPSPSPMSTFINVQISLQKVLSPCPVPAVRFVDNDPMNIINLSPLSHLDPKIRTSASSNLSYLSGTVRFSSPCSLALQSAFLVYLDNSRTPLHSEIAPLKCLSSESPTKQPGWLYSSEIAPDFWDTLCSSPDLTRYTILQSVKPTHYTAHFESSVVTDYSRASPTVFIAYKFSYQKPGLKASTRWHPFHLRTQRHTIQHQHHPTANPSRWRPYHPRIHS